MSIPLTVNFQIIAPLGEPMFKLFSAIASWLDPVLPYAPFLTPVVGIGAAVIAMRAIAQKSIARKRAAIDFFLKTDLDQNMLTAHADFESALKNLKKHVEGGGTIKAFAEDAANEPDYRQIIRYLNIHELMAVGIKNKVFDERVCYNYWSDAMVRHVREAASLVEYEIETGSAAACWQLRQLSRRWSAKIDRWNRRHKPAAKK